MTLKTQSALYMLLGLFVGSIVFVPFATEAKSATWERTFERAGRQDMYQGLGVYFFTNYDGKYYNCEGGYHVSKETGKKTKCGYSKMVLTSLSVTYGVKVTRKDTGEVVLDGAAVPVGTELLLEFEPFEDKDIKWFGDVLTWGGYTDSPQGKWVAETPGTTFSGPKCDNSDFLSRLHDTANSEVRYYGRYHVKRPDISITNFNGLECGALQGRLMNCTATKAGAFTPQFNFTTTKSRFWAMEKDNFKGNGKCSVASDPIDVDSVSIPYTIVVTENNAPPTSPVVAGPTTGIHSVKHTFSFRSTDPNGDTIRYGIDWDRDSSIDEWTPASGYVPSGTTGNGSRGSPTVWNSAGVKTFQARAQDSKGALSSWSSYSITLSNPSSTPPTNLPSNQPVDGDTDDLTACPNGFVRDPKTLQCKRQECFDAFFCRGANLYRGNSGTCRAALVQACAPGFCSAGACVAPPAPDIVLWEVKPTLDIKGYTATITWNAVNVESCIVTGTNGFEAPGNDVTVNAVGEEDDIVNFETTYTITCKGLDGTTAQKETTARLAPVHNED